jgi:hypothetical protein
MTSKVVALQIKPGIQRDGTNLASVSYVDGEWVRFQNGLPKKIGGYNGIFLNASGISRGMYMSALNGLNYVVSGYSDNLEQWVTSNQQGLGSGPTAFTLANFTVSANNLWQFEIGYDSNGAGNNKLVAHPGQNLTNIDSTTDTRPLVCNFTDTTMLGVGIFTSVGTTTSGSTTVTFSSTVIAIGAGLSVTGTSEHHCSISGNCRWCVDGCFKFGGNGNGYANAYI